MVLPTMTDKMFDKLEKLCMEFIWNRHKPRIALEKLMLPKTEGGVDLVNFRKKDASIKIGWLTNLQNDEIVSDLVYLLPEANLHEDIW